jgi:hypothetical protein
MEELDCMGRIAVDDESIARSEGGSIAEGD